MFSFSSFKTFVLKDSKLFFTKKGIGATPSPYDCHLIYRGLKTLEARMAVHYQNSMRVAEFLETHPMVRKVLYTGLPSHPQYEIHK